MSTITSPEIISKIIAGNGFYPGDEHLEPVVRIIKYTNAWGGTCFGTEFPWEAGKYRASEYVNDPELYWELPNWEKKYGHR